MAERKIALEETSSKGRYVLKIDSVADEAELTFSKVNKGLVIADHTYVPDAMRGTGAGKALAERLVADAGAGGYRIVPLCPFLRALSQKHPDWADVIQN
jgi:hypothetical protein